MRGPVALSDQVKVMRGDPRSTKPRKSESDFARAPKFFQLLDQDKDLPLQERLYRRVRHLILTGALANGSRLAPSRALAAKLGISRTSVMAAIDRLVADGWLQPRPNSGVYVFYSGLRLSAPTHAGSNIPENSVPFQLGWPSDHFPLKIWKKLQLRHWRTMPGSALRPGDRLGLLELRKVIAAHLATSRGLECSAEQVIVTTSIPAGVDLAMRVLGLAGNEIWVEDPCGRSKFFALLSAGLRLVPVPVDDRGMDVKAAKWMAPRARAAIVSPTCQAPTGVALSEERRAELVRWAETSSAWIFEDDFNWDGDGISRTLRPIAAVDRIRTLYFNSFNHILFPGLRVAYFVVPTDLIERFDRIRGTEGDVNMPNQMVLTDFIEGGFLDDHLRRLNFSNAERRTALATGVQRELAPIITSKNTPGGYFICSLNGVSEAVLLRATLHEGIVVNGMSDFRMVPCPVEEVILGFSQFKPEALSDAASRLRSILKSNFA
jgi:GntR family transcriptional regulator/MocR family aminotransferase